MSLLPIHRPGSPPGAEPSPGSYSGMDSDPDSAPGSTPDSRLDTAPSPVGVPQRIPNLGHALLFVSFAGLLLVLLQLTLVALERSLATGAGGGAANLHPRLQIAMLATTYLTTLLAAWFFFPVLWQRSFLGGLSWHWTTARSQAGKLIGLGFLLGIMMQIVTYFITPPKTLPIDLFFSRPADAWMITVFGTLVAPVFEEICFRGFLVPAFAIAYDWLSLARTEQARTRWQTSSSLTSDGLLFSAILTSALFAVMHAQQVAHLWVALLVLFAISLVLTFVRVKTQSVAASALVHAAYNGFVFLTVIASTGGYRHLDRMTH